MRNYTPLFIASLLLLMWLGAQAQQNNYIHAVAYVDLMPSASSNAQTQFNQYLQTSQKETGFINLILLQELDRPGRMVVLETWRDQASWATHETQTNQRWQTSLQAIRLGSYDQRLYRELFVNETATTEKAKAIYVVTHVDIGGGPQGDASTPLQQYCRNSREAAGNLGCAVLQGAQRSNHFTVLSIWKDRAALTAHQSAAPVRAFRNEIEPMTGSPLDERLYQPVN